MKYRIKIVGITPLLMKRDNFLAQDQERAAAQDSQTPKEDDRYPADRWLQCLYVDEKNVVIPSTNIMACLRDAGKELREGRKSLKAASQTAIRLEDVAYPLLLENGKPVRVKDILAIKGDFAEHEAAVKNLGFSLFVHPVRVERKRHIRVRPMFSNWAINLVAEIDMPRVKAQMLFTKAGRDVGLCDWRPSSPEPGPYGRFEATIL